MAEYCAGLRVPINHLFEPPQWNVDRRGATFMGLIGIYVSLSMVHQHYLLQSLLNTEPVNRHFPAVSSPISTNGTKLTAQWGVNKQFMTMKHRSIERIMIVGIYDGC